MKGLSPEELLRNAETLLRHPSTETAGLWPRAAALLTRQALEGAVDRLWETREPGLVGCTARSQLLCLPYYIDEVLAERLAATWEMLSRACHHHVYELPPTAEELTSWIGTVRDLVRHADRTGGATG